MAMIATNQIKIRDLKYPELFPAICEALNELYTLSGKYKDVEQIKIFATALTQDLPGKYPYLTIEQLRAIFKMAIMGDFGELKTVSLPDIFRWLRKWQDGAKNGNTTVAMLAHPDSQPGDLINWSREAFKTYDQYLNNGLTPGQFSHLLYERLQMDNFIPLEGYRKHIERAAGLLGLEVDPLNEVQRNLAKKYAVLEVFDRLKNKGVPEIYKMHKDV